MELAVGVVEVVGLVLVFWLFATFVTSAVVHVADWLVMGRRGEGDGENEEGGDDGDH